jgi:type I restriction enzyme S subunit
MSKYQSYKPSGVEWIGEIPNEWSIKRLTYSFKIQKGKIPSELVDEPIVNGLPYLSMDVLRGNEPTEFSKDKNIVEVEDGDIGILWDGSNSGEIIKINRNGILSSTVSLLTIIDKGLIKEFGYYLLKLFENDFKSNTTGMGIPHVNGNYVRETKLIIPPTDEQHQIVQFLDEKTKLIDKLISTKERKITLLKEQRTSLINEVVTKGLNPNVKMKDSGVEWIGEIPEHWEITKLKYLVTFDSGYSFNSSDYVDEGVNLIRIGSLYDNTLDLERSPVFLPIHFLNQYQNFVVKKNDILISLTGTLGKRDYGYSIVYDKDFPSLLNQRVGRLKLKSEDLNFKLFTSILHSEYYLNQLFCKPSGTKQGNFSSDDIVSNYIFLPPNQEQLQIVGHLDSKTKEIDDLVQLEQKKIDLLKEYRQSLISEVVTGKIKVTN